MPSNLEMGEVKLSPLCARISQKCELLNTLGVALKKCYGTDHPYDERY
jgi:hypothetical protein